MKGAIRNKILVMLITMMEAEEEEEIGGYGAMPRWVR